jgi:hypothetical protein
MSSTTIDNVVYYAICAADGRNIAKPEVLKRMGSYR